MSVYTDLGKCVSAILSAVGTCYPFSGEQAHGVYMCVCMCIQIMNFLLACAISTQIFL